MFEVLLEAWYGIGKKREGQNMNHEINQLIQFGLDHHLIQEEDVDYTVNLLLDLLKNSFTSPLERIANLGKLIVVKLKLPRLKLISLFLS